MFSWPGVQKPLEQYGPEGGAAPPAAKAAAEDDDDFDLFGSEVSRPSYVCACTVIMPERFDYYIIILVCRTRKRVK